MRIEWSNLSLLVWITADCGIPLNIPIEKEAEKRADAGDRRELSNI